MSDATTEASANALKIGRGFALPLDMVTEATAIVATRGAGKSSTGAVYVEEAIAAHVQTAVLDWTGVFWGLRSNKTGDGPGLPIYVFGGAHGDLPLEATAGHLMADLVVDSGNSFVFDLSDLGKEAKRRFCAEFLDRLYDRKGRARTTLLLLIDEAHELAPQTPRGGFKGWSALLMGAIESVVSLGRSRGLGVILITQRTQALNKSVLDLVEQMLVMRMLSPRSVKAVREWIEIKDEKDEAGVIPSLPDLPTGTAWVWAPLRGILQKVQIRRIRTFDSYRHPKAGETLVEPTVRRELDLAALGAQIAATVEKAKADDPAELRKRIRELEQERDSAPAQVERVEVPVTVERIVEVPVVPEELRDLIERVVASAQETAQKYLSEVRETVAKLDLATAARVAKSVEEAEVEAGAAASPVGVAAPPRPGDDGRRRERGIEPPASSPTSNGELGVAARSLLETLARHYPVRLTVSQMAMMDGRKPRGGSFNGAMRELRDGDYIEEPDGMIVASQHGLDSAGVLVTGPRSTDEILEMWRRSLPTAAREIFDILARVYPDSRNVEAIADELGKKPSGGSWNSALRTLISNRLATKDGHELRAHDDLYVSRSNAA